MKLRCRSFDGRHLLKLVGCRRPFLFLSPSFPPACSTCTLLSVLIPVPLTDLDLEMDMGLEMAMPDKGSTRPSSCLCYLYRYRRDNMLQSNPYKLDMGLGMEHRMRI